MHRVLRLHLSGMCNSPHALLGFPILSNYRQEDNELQPLSLISTLFCRRQIWILVSANFKFRSRHIRCYRVQVPEIFNGFRSSSRIRLEKIGSICIIRFEMNLSTNQLGNNDPHTPTPIHTTIRREPMLKAVRERINWDQVHKIASALRSQTCTSDCREFSGSCNIVYSIVFEDDTRWALRVPYEKVPVEDTVNTMRCVKSAVPEIPIATVYTWSDSEDGDGVGTPYMLLDWIEGRTLKQWTTTFPPALSKQKVLAQLAQFSVDLLVCTPVQSNPRSALEYVLRRIDSRLRRIFAGDLPSFDPIDCLIYRAMWEEKYHLPSLDDLPFPLMHTDLSLCNFLVDDNCNITGILDWDDGGCRLPVQCAVMCPAIIAIANDPLYHAPKFHKGRLAFADHFRSAVNSSGLRDKIAVQLPSLLVDDELQIFHASIGSKSIYSYWVKMYCVRSPQWVKAASKALEKYLLAEPEMAHLSEVLSVRIRLLRMQDEGFVDSKVVLTSL